jgi:hypothetical protein
MLQNIRCSIEWHLVAFTWLKGHLKNII